MTKARIIALADAIVTTLNGHDFSIAFKAERAYKPETKAENLKVLRAFVIPASYTGEFLNRARLTHDERVVDVGLLKHIATHDLAEADSLMLLVDEVFDYFVDHSNLTAEELDYVLIKPPENAPVFHPSMINEDRIFCSVLRLTYKAGRAA